MIKFKLQVLLLLLGLSTLFFNSLHAVELEKNRETFVYDLKEAEKLAANENKPDEMTHKLLYADRLFHLRSLDEKYRKDALEWYQRVVTLSEEKYPAVYYRLAVLFDEMSDTKKANFYFEEAKNLNNTPAKYKIGMFYILGQHGYQKDPERGLALLKEAAESKNVDAMELLGMLYANGILLPYDMDQALFWSQKMHEEKIIQNYLTLSSLFNAKGWLEINKNNNSNLEDTFKENTNFKTAFEFTQKAADLGSEKAAEQLAGMYDTGLGVEIDKEKAEFWKAKALGSHKNLDKIDGGV